MYIILSPTVSQVNAMTDSIWVVVQSSKKMNEKATTKRQCRGKNRIRRKYRVWLERRSLWN